MTDVLAQPYIQAARARGIPERRIILRHAVRNVLAPIVNITGLQLGFLFGGALFSEVIFNWPGIGFLVFESLGARDVPVIQTVVLFTGVLFVAINLVSDVAQAVIDPRTRSA
jgi:peptide/nickel transport system permease protein